MEELTDGGLEEGWEEAKTDDGGGALEEGWEEAKDEESGNIYYFNTATGESCGFWCLAPFKSPSNNNACISFLVLTSMGMASSKSTP